MASLRKRIDLFKREITEFDEKIHANVRHTERQIEENTVRLQFLDDQIKSFDADIDKYYRDIKDHTLHYQGCTSNSNG